AMLIRYNGDPSPILASNCSSYHKGGTIYPSLQRIAPSIGHPRKLQVNHATSVAMMADGMATTGMARPSIPKLVKVAKIPAAGVKPPYIQDWNAAAIEPSIPN